MKYPYIVAFVAGLFSSENALEPVEAMVKASQKVDSLVPYHSGVIFCDSENELREIYECPSGAYHLGVETNTVDVLPINTSLVYELIYRRK